MKVRVDQLFLCPSCGLNYDEGELIYVKVSPMGISATHECENCGEEIELLLNDDNTVEL